MDEKNRLVGIITRGDLLRGLEQDPEGKLTVLEAGTSPAITAYADESLYEAAERMLGHNIGRLPVVERNDGRRVVGYLGRSGVLAARLRMLEEENVREAGWWPKRKRDA